MPGCCLDDSGYCQRDYNVNSIDKTPIKFILFTWFFFSRWPRIALKKLYLEVSVGCREGVWEVSEGCQEELTQFLCGVIYYISVIQHSQDDINVSEAYWDMFGLFSQ